MSLRQPAILVNVANHFRSCRGAVTIISVDTALILELLRPFHAGLNAVQAGLISTYIDILLRWNAKMNLTSIRDPEQIVKRHFGEAVFLACQLSDRTLLSPGTSVFDIGSGAGFPGIPLKIVCPQIALTLVEAHGRKAIFLKEVLRAINLDAQVKNVRAEELARDLAASADIVTLRAVEKFEAILPVAAEFVRPAGKLALLIGRQQAPVAQNVLKSWRSDPFLLLPTSESRGILLLNQDS